MKQKKKHKFTLSFYKEVFLSMLAVLSVILVFYEFFGSPDAQVTLIITRFDIAVALIFLTDFSLSFLQAKNKAKFMSQNWYLLLASIPIVDGWAELLRGLRLLALLRLIRAGEHLNYVVSKSKPAK